MGQEIKVNVTPVDGVLEIVNRTGEASEIHEPEKKNISGDIQAVMTFLTHEVGAFEIDTKKSHLEIDKEALTATLFVNGNDPLATNVTSTIVKNQDLKDLGLNGNKKFNQEELKNFLRQKKYMFPDKDEHALLFVGIKNMHVKAQIEIQEASDDRGNVANNFTKNVSADSVPLKCKVRLPIFKNQAPVELHLEIGLDTAERSVRFFFLSDTIDEIIKSEVDKKFEEMANIADNVGVMVIYK